MFHVVIRGKRYKIVAKRLPIGIGGQCDSPATKGREIRIRKRLGIEMLLENLIHETLHAAAWDLDEEAVVETAEAIAKVLLRAGISIDPAETYRRLAVNK